MRKEAFRRQLTLPIITIALLIPAAIMASFHRPYDGDEFTLASSITNLWLGAPTLSLAWPCSLQILFGHVFVVLSFLVRGGHSLAAFGQHLYSLVSDPYGLIIFLRALNIFLAVGALYLFANFLIRKGRPGWLVLAVCAAFAWQPTILHYTATAKGDGPALWLALIALTFANEEEETKAKWVGISLGLMLACRLSYLPVTILILVLAHFRWKSRETTLRILGILAITLAITCPFIWTDPVRFMKAILGQLARPGTPVGVAAAVKDLAHMFGPWMIALLLIFAGLAVMRRKWLALALSAAVVLLYVVALSRQAIYYDRYLLATALALPILVLSLPGLTVEKRYAPILGGVGACLTALLTVQSLLAANRAKEGVQVAADRRSAVQKAIEVAGNKEVLLPMEMLGTGTGIEANIAPADAATLRLQVTNAYSSPGRIAYGREDLAPLKDALTEREKTVMADMRLCENYSQGTAHIRLWAEKEESNRFGFLSSEDAVAELKKGAAKAAVMETKDALSQKDLNVIAKFGDLAVVQVRQ